MRCFVGINYILYKTVLWKNYLGFDWANKVAVCSADVPFGLPLRARERRPSSH